MAIGLPTMKSRRRGKRKASRRRRDSKGRFVKRR